MLQLPMKWVVLVPMRQMEAFLPPSKRTSQSGSDLKHGCFAKCEGLWLSMQRGGIDFSPRLQDVFVQKLQPCEGSAIGINCTTQQHQF